MGIVNITTDVPGQIGVKPRRVKIISTDNLATVTTAGYLNGVILEGYTIYNTDIIDMWYGATISSGPTVVSPGTYEVFIPSFSNGVITLTGWVDPADVLLPVVSGDFATFNGTSGQIKDAGYLPTDATKTRVVMQSAASVVGDFPKYLDITGTIVDSGISPTNAAKTKAVMLDAAPTINHIAKFTAADGTIGDGGVLGTAAAKAASDNTKATLASINGATTVNHIAQFSDIAGTIQDGGVLGTAAAKATSDNTKATVAAVSGSTVLGNLAQFADTAGTVSDQGVAFKSVGLAAVAGGAAAQTVTDAFCTSTSCVVASWNDTTNAVSIEKVAAGNGSFVVTSSGDPGSSHISYIITK